MKVRREKIYSSTLSFISAVDGEDNQVQAPSALPQGKKPDAYCTGGWIELRDSLDGCRKFHTHRDSIPRPFST